MLNAMDRHCELCYLGINGKQLRKMIAINIILHRHTEQVQVGGEEKEKSDISEDLCILIWA